MAPSGSGFRRLEIVIGAAVAVVACALATGPGWLAAAEHGTAARLGVVVPWAPGYGAIVELAARLPIGEVGFRLALVSAVMAGILAAGVVAMARALVAREVGAAIGAALALALVTAVEVAATTPGPAMMIAAGVAWTVAGVIAMRRGEDRAEAGAVPAIAGLSIALGGAPYVGLALALIAVPMVWRRRRVLLAIPALVIVPLVIVAGVPPIAAQPFGRIADIAGALGADAGVIVLGAGALGLGFGAATGLRGAGLALVAMIAVAIGGAVTPIAPAEVAVAILGVLALGIAVLATAGIRAAAATLDGTRRSAIAAALSIVFPLLALTMTAGRPELDGDAPARAATDLAAAAPAGPGAIFVGGDALVTALRYERAIAGLRPDLVLRPRRPDDDALAIGYLRAGQVVAADVPAFGRLDDHYARPLGRGFQLLLETGNPDATPDPPATYPGAIGRAVAARLALARGLWEAGAGSLDHAARAGGFAGTRFDAGAVALLAAVVPSPQHPALFGFVPAIGAPTDQDWLALLGDDLAWVGGILEPPLPDSAPAIRVLHARWRAVLAGIAPPADPAIRALGHTAVVATREMLKATGHTDAADKLAP